MSTTANTNKATLMHWAETWNMTRNRETFYALFADHCKFHSLPEFGAPPTKAGFRQVFDTFLEAFPNIHISMEELIAEGDKVACLVMERGTQTGAWQGIPATNKRVAFPEFIIYRFEEGKVVEWHYYPDMFKLLSQLGALPAN